MTHDVFYRKPAAQLVSEIEAVKRARIQGLTNDEIRVLVKELVAARSNVTGDTCHD